MGIAKTHGRRNNTHQRLAALAGELEPRRAPFYVHNPTRQVFAPGWWWQPRGADGPVFLGHNHIVAETELLQLLDAQDKPS